MTIKPSQQCRRVTCHLLSLDLAGDETGRQKCYSVYDSNTDGESQQAALWSIVEVAVCYKVVPEI